ncbi:MAG: hypothetical protein MUF34_36005 [Polyangiaceae bacterium]|nr:hypothetical protein [Polyangiaceae bacterium]
MPFSAPSKQYDATDSCSNVAGGVQLVEWRNDTLTKRALLPMRGNPRRALENGSELVAISDSNVRTFSLADRDSAIETADVVIGACTATTTTPAPPAGCRGAEAASGRSGCSGSSGWPQPRAVAAPDFSRPSRATTGTSHSRGPVG